MARILLGWELGANRGHAVRLAGLAESLRAHGHEIVFAVRRLDVMRVQRVPDAPIWQAPVSPRMLSGGQRVTGIPAGMAEILARLGMDDADVVAAMVAAWRALFSAIRPDVVVGDFAPFLLLAARGRIPVISVGTGFSTPPATMDSFPVLASNGTAIDQAQLRDTVNAGLADVGDPPIAALPAIFAADRPIVGTFTELDVYATMRRTTLALPESIDPAAVAGSGDEVFVYMPELVPTDSPLWTGLAESGLRVRVHVALSSPELQAAVRQFGFTVEPEPIPFARIAERSRLILSHGGHGIICAGLAAGIPHVVCYYDLEKLSHGLALARVRLGGHVSLGGIKPKTFAESLVKLHGDADMMQRARTAGPGFLARGQQPLHDAVADAVMALA